MTTTANPYAAPQSNVNQDHSSDDGSLPLASLGARLGGAAIDFGLMAMAAGITIAAFAFEVEGRGDPGPMTFGVGAVLILGLAITQITLLCTRAQTVGKAFVGTRIDEYEGGGMAGAGRAFFLRGVVVGLIGNIPIVGLLFSLADPLFIFGAERRCLHDLVAGTKVVKL